MNGHKNWNHWNVALWINNDQGLYNQARQMVRRYGKARAAGHMLDSLEFDGITRTPDGAPYTKTTIRAALRDM